MFMFVNNAVIVIVGAVILLERLILPSRIFGGFYLPLHLKREILELNRLGPIDLKIPEINQLSLFFIPEPVGK